jgi:hypothetical protein
MHRLPSATVLAIFAILTICGSASAQTRQFFAILDGGNETDPADTNGQGVASVMLGATGQLCFSILARGINTPIAAHVHRGKAGVAGPIVLPLTTPTTAGIPGSFASTGCLDGQNAGLLDQIRSNPQNFYVNVHSGQFQDGAIRGQLF